MLWINDKFCILEWTSRVDDFKKLNKQSNTAINFKQILQLLRWHWYKRKVMLVVILHENDVYINHSLLPQLL